MRIERYFKVEKNNERNIKRGDIFYYDFGENPGSIQCGLRPVLVLQADNFNRNSPTVIIAAITSVNKKRYLPSHIDLGENFGLKKPSMVLLEQIQTVNQTELLDYVGSIDDEQNWKQINIGLKKRWAYGSTKQKEKAMSCVFVLPVWMGFVVPSFLQYSILYVQCSFPFIEYRALRIENYKNRATAFGEIGITLSHRDISTRGRRLRLRR